MKSWAIVFSIPFLINFGIVYNWHIYQCLDKRFWFKILSFHLKGSWNLFQILLFFRLNRKYFVPAGVINDRITVSVTLQSFLMENCDHTICHLLSIFLYDSTYEDLLFKKFIVEVEASDSFKITCILVRRQYLLRQMVVSSGKFIV